MGWSYVHVALFGPTQDEVASVLSDRNAVISPTVGNFTLVADEEFESGDVKLISVFAAELSNKLACPAMVVSEFDDDVLCYCLIEAGAVIDEYNSEPDYFDFAGKHVPPRSPLGGNAERLCAVLKRNGAQERVDLILHTQDMGLPAPERHQKLSEALGMPEFAVGFDYEALRNGELPNGLDELDVIFTRE